MQSSEEKWSIFSEKVGVNPTDGDGLALPKPVSQSYRRRLLLQEQKQ
jgi:hypothetical protein